MKGDLGLTATSEGFVVCVFMLWIANAVVAFGFPPMVSAIGISNSFFIFAALGVLALIFIAKMVPETRGRTLEQFEDEMRAASSGTAAASSGTAAPAGN